MIHAQASKAIVYMHDAVAVFTGAHRELAKAVKPGVSSGCMFPMDSLY